MRRRLPDLQLQEVETTPMPRRDDEDVPSPYVLEFLRDAQRSGMRLEGQRYRRRLMEIVADWRMAGFNQAEELYCALQELRATELAE